MSDWINEYLKKLSDYASLEAEKGNISKKDFYKIAISIDTVSQLLPRKKENSKEESENE